jgi:solute carrier family 25 phosphate transporter 23/24/25/41
MPIDPSSQPLGTPDITSLQRVRQVFAQPVLASFVAGGVAGAVSRTVVSPLERLKILFQIQSVGREEYKMSVPKALAKMWREEGWRGFMAGNGTNCIRIVPYSAVQFSAYNVYKRVSFFSSVQRVFDFSERLAFETLERKQQGKRGRKSGAGNLERPTTG